MTGGLAARPSPLRTGWLFGPAAPGSSLPGFDDSGFTAVTLPHRDAVVLAELGSGGLGAGLGVPQALRCARRRVRVR